MPAASSDDRHTSPPLLLRRLGGELRRLRDEATIQRLVGMPEVMDDQLARLRLAAQMSNITLQVLPFRAGTQEGMSGSFMILVELPAGQLYLDDEDHLRRYTRVFERLQAGALSGEESTAFMAVFARARDLHDLEVPVDD